MELRSFGEDVIIKANEYTKIYVFIIFLHVEQEISVPMSAKAAKKLLYTDLVIKFKDAGFINVKLEAEYDLVTGWFTKDGSVESISVNGETSFDEYALYRPDVEVVITYHTFSKNKDG